MTNLEYYKDQFIEMIGSEDVDFCCYFNELHDLGCDSCPCCEKYSPKCNVSKFYDWLLEEHKEPIKLKQWEYDMIRTNDMSHSSKFNSFNTYKSMKRCGYFNGITDTSMTIKEILDNCEIVD